MSMCGANNCFQGRLIVIRTAAILFLMIFIVMSAGAVRADADSTPIDGEMKDMNTKTATFAMG